jgi:hypothetical protein
MFKAPAAALLACVLGSLAMSCAVSSQVGPEAEGELQAEEAELSAARSTYFVARPDQRKCMSPICGGVWVHRVNFASTTCADGSHAAECYVAGFDYAKAGLTESDVSPVALEQRAFRGTLKLADFNGHKLAKFYASEVWSAANDTPATGTFYAVGDNGIRCKRAPCPSLDAAKLNSSAAVVQVSGLTGPTADKAGSVVGGGTTILASGTIKNAAGNSHELALTQFYRRLGHDPMSCVTDDECTPTPYAKLVTTASECFCPICPSSVMNVTAATANYESWQAICSTRKLTCPAVKCVAPRPAACVANVCQFVDR